MNRRLMWVRVAAVCVALGACLSPLHADGTGEDPFLGEWSIHAEPDSATADEGQTAFSEAVLFHNGEFSAAVFATFGFSPTAYTVESEDGPTRFVAVLPSTERGTLTWTGRMTPTGLAGTLVWERDNGHTYRYTITGERSNE